MSYPVGAVRVLRVDSGSSASLDDLLVTEEPLEIRLGLSLIHISEPTRPY